MPRARFHTEIAFGFTAGLATCGRHSCVVLSCFEEGVNQVEANINADDVDLFQPIGETT
jgi:hypothetical protein